MKKFYNDFFVLHLNYNSAPYKESRREISLYYFSPWNEIENKEKIMSI